METVSQYDSAFFYYARFSSNDRKFFVRGNFKKYFTLDRYAPVFDKMLESFRLFSGRNLTTHSSGPYKSLDRSSAASCSNLSLNLISAPAPVVGRIAYASI